jgi:hypothetical protein
MGSLHGVGGYFSGTFGANLAIVLDNGTPIGGGKLGIGHQFFGALDTRPTGFTRFEFRELDGKVGQALYVWGDDFVLVGSVPTSTPEQVDARFLLEASPNPTHGRTVLWFSLSDRADAQLAIYDLRGRLVRKLTDAVPGTGSNAIEWDGRDEGGVRVSSGVYFARLESTGGGHVIQNRKIVMLQ